MNEKLALKFPLSLVNEQQKKLLLKKNTKTIRNFAVIFSRHPVEKREDLNGDEKKHLNFFSKSGPSRDSGIKDSPFETFNII